MLAAHWVMPSVVAVDINFHPGASVVVEQGFDPLS